MKHVLRRYYIVVVLGVVIASMTRTSLAEARSYVFTPTDLPYTDKSTIDATESVSIGVLTEEHILQGNPDGTFRIDTYLNRAEFVTIVMRLLGEETVANTANCFPDVSSSAWYAPTVCYAKSLGYIRGNAQSQTPEHQWRFEPNRNVLYAEAVKILVELYNLPYEGETEGELWFLPYINVSSKQNLHLNVPPEKMITRGEMAQLTARFLAHSENELDLLLAAEKGKFQSSSLSSSSSAHTLSSTSSFSSSVSSQKTDPDADISVQSTFLLAGSISSVLGVASIFPEAEPLIVDTIVITLLEGSSEVSAFQVYNAEGVYLGRATRDYSRGQHTFSLPMQGTIIPRRESRQVYVRAEIRNQDQGAISGQQVTLGTLGVEGTGYYSNSSYRQQTSESFQTSIVSFAKMNAVTNAGATTGILVPGAEQELGSFTFHPATAASYNDLRLINLDFTLERTGNIGITNVLLRSPESGETMPCSVSSSTIECHSIPSSIGSMENNPVTLTVYGDVSMSGNVRGTLRLSLNNAGRIGAPGAIKWSDGETTFNWTQFDLPIARGTSYSN